jgi:hypothetical protein
MASFLQVWESSLGSGPPEDTKAMRAIRAGMHVREDFWQDFMNVCNNAEAMAALLDVRVDQVTSWGSKVRHGMGLVEEADRRESPNKKKMMQTGKFDFED